MMSSNRYQRVGNDDLIENVTELTEIVPTAPIEGEFAVANPIHPESQGSLSVKILLKEKSFELTGLSESTTIGELKSAVETATTVPTAQQRLICAGKQLKPDTKKLSDFKISSGCSIHLFPLPVTVSSVPVANAVSSEGGQTTNPLTAQVVSASSTSGSEIAHRPIHFDPYINQTSREVKLWCLILMFLSGMTLFNNLSYVTASGRLGQGILDSIVTVIDTACSALGLVVANMGIQSVRTMELDDVNKYVRALVGLASVAVILRVLWVIDVILQVQKVVKESQQEDGDGDGKGKEDPTAGMDDPTTAGQPMDDRTVVSFGIQACIIALICIFAWGSCVMRARRLQIAVANYSNAMQV